jgi:hypothetical protein
MLDPHVESLEYDAQPLKWIGYTDPRPVQVRNDLFEGELKALVLSLRLLKHHATEAEARSAVQPYLRAWEIHAGITRGASELRFQFKSAVMIDRALQSPEGLVGEGHMILAPPQLAGTARLTLIRGTYPEMPEHFTVTPLVETLWTRLEGYRDGKEPLASMAYFCLTALENEAGTRRAAANFFHIDEKVLRTLGHLTSERGGPAARKARPAAPLSSQESAWIESALTAIIGRIGERAARQSSSRLRLADLPPL